MSTLTGTPLAVNLSPPSSPPVANGCALRRFSVDEYHRMIAADILNETDKVELLDGYLVLKMARNPPHDATIQINKKRLSAVLPTGWDLRIQSAVTLPASELEPDVAVVRGDEYTYVACHPGPADIGLLIEVADTSLDRDRLVKGPLYAAAAIPIYWIINLLDRQVEVYTAPSGPSPNPAYAQRQDVDVNSQAPLVLDGTTVALLNVRDLLP